MDLNYIERWLADATVNYQDGRPAVGLGLIITVFFRNGHTPEVRQKMVGCVDRFYNEFHTHLKKQMNGRWVGITEKNYAKKRQEIIDSSPEEIFDWYLTSSTEDYLAPDYAISIMGKRIFHNDNNRSVIKLTFPLSLLNEEDGPKRYQDWLLWLCNEFEVESGYAGISFSLPQEFHRMFPYEYSLAQRFPGVMVDSIGMLEGGDAVEGIKGACWYTILGNRWVEKLGGVSFVNKMVADTPEIAILSYNQGLILQASQQPPGLGEINDEGLPSLLVKVNQIIRPIRQDGHNSLHFYSMEDNHQFNKESSMKWYARFDEASDKLPIPELLPDEHAEPARITAYSGETSPHTGRWGTFIDGSLRYVHVKHRQTLPEYEDKEGKLHRTLWSLLERDDKGSVFINS
ncbi:ImpA family protein [Rahnella aquatilis CIP 78.65 = ATCC 33071]|uniref:DUF3396 domain-containing protein n=1 Tax=Rahnella aquatilis (strain ATCC 33071 / DSM 4594 / JCM 1683 / NBRC 105701 / NCIMB 13365 / CIP 78.65) TaxID=745277 RepID=H2ISG0_RAHAC|nr:DUF3396 domain-containing protein [Rahnella aquatilis]AEX52608.1 Protein of unknown function (DUF3396) [Rahnella aquatilis CIP 78.65 = ATCC 33071]KFD05909.1 ImpA family protein [Rahnella aquatilis CIP 78.65 = ATCC 33071]